MKRALLVRKYGALTPKLRKTLFPGWDLIAYGEQVRGGYYDAIVCAFEENTQREIEWVDNVVEATLRKGGKFMRTG